MGEKHLVNDCAMLTLGFGNCALQYHFVAASVKQTCILSNDLLQYWGPDINYKMRKLTLCVKD